MITYLVLVDRRGQPQRVATSDNEADVQRYIDAGFTVITASEYNQAAALVPSAELDDLPALAAATGLLTQIQNQQRRIAGIPNVDPARLDALQTTVREEYRRITTAFTGGQLSAEQWYRQMVDLVNRANIAASALAVGGVQNLSTEDVRSIERANETQAAYLNRFRREVEQLSVLAMIARAVLYAGAIAALYWMAVARMMGMPPLPAQPGVLTRCHGNCKCSWDIQRLPGNGNFDAYWRLRPAEHCPNCLRRAQEFNPLKIRNGIIQPFNPNGIYST